MEKTEGYNIKSDVSGSKVLVRSEDMPQIPVPEPLLCRIGLHRWSIWSDTITTGDFMTRFVYGCRYQKRACLRCCKEQVMGVL